MALLEFLKKNEGSRKIFGQRELKIVEKQLLGVNLTQSEKNRLSRDIRKKLEFIKRIMDFKDEFELKKGAKIKEVIKESIKLILKSKYAKDIQKIFLFGSAADNRLNLFSDVDIAVDFEKIGKKEAFEFRKELLGELPEKVDLQVINFLPGKINKEIEQKGKIIYEKQNKR
jgi:predicted nucleotidyltransferase